MTPWKHAVWNVFDTETTGIDPKDHRVIEFGIVRMQNGMVLQQWGQVFHPNREVSEEVRGITGISQAEIDEAPRIGSYLDGIDSLLDGGVWVAYNAFFDILHLTGEFLRHGLSLAAAPPIDPLVWVRKLDKYEKGKKLANACARRGIEFTAHRAADDALATGRLLMMLQSYMPDNFDEMIAQQEAMREEQRREMKAFFIKKGKTEMAANM